MSEEEEIKRALAVLIKRFSIVSNIENATIVSVDQDKDTCVVKTHSNDTLISDVRLTAVETSGTTKFCIYPKLGSDVLIMYYPGQTSQAMVVKYSLIQEIKIKAEDTVELNGDSNGGMVKVAELTSKLNAIENKLNSLIGKYNIHVHPETNAANTLVTINPETPIASITTRSDIENTKVTH